MGTLQTVQLVRHGVPIMMTGEASGAPQLSQIKAARREGPGHVLLLHSDCHSLRWQVKVQATLFLGVVCTSPREAS